MKKRQPSETIERLRTIQIALYSENKSTEKRELLRQLEFKKDIREHLADVVRAVRSLNKTRGEEAP